MKRTNFYFPEQMLERLKRVAEVLDVPVSKIIRDGVEKELVRLEAEVEPMDRKLQKETIQRVLDIAEKFKQRDMSRDELLQLAKELAAIKVPPRKKIDEEKE